MWRCAPIGDTVDSGISLFGSAPARRQPGDRTQSLSLKRSMSCVSAHESLLSTNKNVLPFKDVLSHNSITDGDTIVLIACSRLELFAL